jgi:hypothetical protein
MTRKHSSTEAIADAVGQQDAAHSSECWKLGRQESSEDCGELQQVPQCQQGPSALGIP